MGKHTPGPWEFKLVDRAGFELPQIFAGGIPVVTGMVARDDIGVDRANADRIVACVNGCEGITNPAGVPDLVSALEELIATYPINEDYRANSNDEQRMVNAIRFANRTLAKTKRVSK